MMENASTHSVKDGTEKIFSYCIHCAALCGVVAHVRDGYLIKVEGDSDSLNNAGTLCPKGLAAKQEIYHPGRLKHPMKRTKPKGDPDPGWMPHKWEFRLRHSNKREASCLQALIALSGEKGRKTHPIAARILRLH